MKPSRTLFLAASFLISGLLSPGLQASGVTVLVSFTGPNGANPNGGLLPGGDGNFYGVTTAGGANNYGTLFRLTPPGALSTLVSFNQTNGAGPRAGLAQGADGQLYGTAYYGGAHNVGTVFKLSTNQVFSALASFAHTNGANPIADLTPGADGNFYGTTAIGGTSSGGSVVQISPGGSVTPVASFGVGSTNGFNVYGRVVQTPDGRLFGTTFSGGAFGFGTVFQTTTSGVRTTVYSFRGTNDGANPFAGLAQGADGQLYGSTFYGGTNGAGTLFKVTTNGAFTTLFSFARTNGANPQAALVSGADGGLYGTTTYGGWITNAFGQGFGTIFKLTTNGTVTPLISFANTNGANPQGVLAFGADGRLYGTTAAGGPNDLGVVFRLGVPSPPVFQSVTQSGATITLNWSALAGESYQLQSSTNLHSPNWINLGTPITATNHTATASDHVGSALQRFYRAVLLP